MGVTQYANKGATTLAIDVLPSDLVVNVVDSSSLPVIDGITQYFYMVLERADVSEFEVVKVTLVVGNALTVQRAQGGTLANNFFIGDRAENRVTKSTLDEFLQKGSDPILPPGGNQYDMLMKQSSAQDDADWVPSLDAGLF